MKQITLWKKGDNPSGLFALVDDKNYEIINRFNWVVSRCGLNVYASTRFNNKTTYMHQFILGDIPIGFEVDHKNGNGLDNQENNLRCITHEQNMANQKTPVNNTSGYKGVSYFKRDKLWHAKLMCKGVRLFLGAYTTKEVAARAYNEAAFKYFGEFAKLNEIK